MPGKNTIKEYVQSGAYHVYNRGVEKRKIFLDKQDHAVFLSYIKESLSEEKTNSTDRNGYVRRKYNQSIDLLAFCLMPNHFHLLIRQKEERAIASFMKCISTRYSMYFNKKYGRSGHLFQGIYKAVLVDNDEQLIHLSRYIHLNPIETKNKYKDYDFSSYAYYKKAKNADWVKTAEIIDYFNGDINSYESFLNDYETTKESLGDDIRDLAIEEVHRVQPCASRKDKKWRG